MGKFLLFTPILSASVLVVAIAEGAEAAPGGFIAWIVPIAIILLLIAFNGLFVAAEFAMIGTRPSQMEALTEEGEEGAGEILAILEDRNRQDSYIATAQLGITLASLGLGMYAEPAIASLIEPYLQSWFNITSPDTLHTISYILVLSVLTYLHMVIGEMVPKAISLSDAAKTVLQLQPAMKVSQWFLAPLVFTLNSIGNSLLKLFNLPEAQPRPHSPEEIEQLVTESAESGLINEEEEEIIRNIFDFSDRRVGQVMTPRPKVELIKASKSTEEIMEFVAASIHTRFPVFDENRDNIIGILHMRDLVEFRLNKLPQFNIRAVLNPAPAVPEDAMVEDLLRLFRRDHIHMAIVLDEVGGLAGVVTLEDLIEEVVGEVRDEFDVEQEPIAEIEPGLYEVEGPFLLSSLIEKEIFMPNGESLPDVDTVGGLIVTVLGRPPITGDTCKVGDTTFTVVEVNGLAVERALIAFKPKPVSETNHH